MKPAPSQLVAIRKDRKFVRAVCWKRGGDPDDAFTPWCADRQFLAEMVDARRARGWTVLYIVTCQLHAREP